MEKEEARAIERRGEEQRKRDRETRGEGGRKGPR